MIVKIQETWQGIGGLGVGWMLICLFVELVCSYPDDIPVVVLSVVEKTINKLLLAGVKAVSTAGLVNKIDELGFIKDLHCGTTNELIINWVVLLQLLKGIAMMKDYLVFVEKRMSPRILAAYLYKIVIKAEAGQYGGAFTNGEIRKINYPTVVKRLLGEWVQDPRIPIVIRFVEKGWKPTVILTLGKEGSDLMATTIDKAFSLPGILVWNDIDGVLIDERSIYYGAMLMPMFTSDRVLKLRFSRNVAISCMLDQLGLLVQAFSMVEELGKSVDVLASSEIINSWILHQSKFWSSNLTQPELDLANWCGFFKKCRSSYNEPKAKFLCSVLGLAHGSRGTHSCRFDSLFEPWGFSQSRPPEEGLWRFKQAVITGPNLEDKVDFEGGRVDKNLGQEWAGPNDCKATSEEEDNINSSCRS